MRKDDGFTLIETLSALIVVSLALACIITATTQVMHVNRRLAASHKEAADTAETVARVTAMLQASEPVMVKDLSGNSDGFECLAGNCRFRANPMHVAYLSDGKSSAYWPPLHWQHEAREPRLDGVVLSDARGRTLAVIDLVTDEPKDCAFDMISRVCRTPAAKAAS